MFGSGEIVIFWQRMMIVPSMVRRVITALSYPLKFREKIDPVNNPISMIVMAALRKSSFSVKIIQ